MHRRFLNEAAAKQVYDRILNRYKYRVKIISLDVSKQTPLMTQLLQISEVQANKVSRKNRPTFLAKVDDRLFRMKANLFNEDFSREFFEAFDSQSQMIEVKSIKDLTESLRRFNRNLSDSVFVYC